VTTASTTAMWRGYPLASLPLMDEQDWPPQPFTLPIPNPVLREAAAVSDVAAFLAIGEAWSQMVSHFLPANPTLLDLGCGCGKQARFLLHNPNLTYIGIDLFLPAIKWCQRAFAPHAARFRFEHFNGISEVYNPGGDIKASEYVFPLDDESVDMTICASLFTHLFEADARHYLEEIARIAKPDGRAIISIHVQPEWGTNYSGDESRIDIDEAYFVEMCEAAGLSVDQRIGVIYGQTAYLLKKGGASAFKPESKVSGVGRNLRKVAQAITLKKGA
jgi:SAM-dependent methyltransferase